MSQFQFTLAARYLMGRKLRSFLTTLSIVIGTLIIFSTNVLLPTMSKSFQTNMMAISGQVDVTITQKTGEAFSRNIANKVNAIPGITSIASSLSRTVNIPTGYYRGTNISALSLTGIEPRAAQKMHRYPILEGRFLTSGDTHSMVISKSLADTLGVKLADKINLPTTDGGVNLKVVGILPARALPGNEEILVTLHEAQNLLNLPARINTIEANLSTTDPKARESIQTQIQQSLGDDYTLGGLSSGSEMLASMRTGQIAFNAFGFLALFMGGFIIFNTFRTIVAERRHDIGMLRAIGANRTTIIGLILFEGLLQGIIGTVIGIVLGYLLGYGSLKLLSGAMQAYIHLEIGTPVVSVWLIVVTSILGVGMTLAAGLLPAIHASRITPLEALRPTVADIVHQTIKVSAIVGIVLIVLAGLGLLSGVMGLVALGGLMFLIGLILVAPLLIRPIAAVISKVMAFVFVNDGTGNLAQSNLNRNPSRAAVTASATMLGLAVIVGLGGLVWSLTGGFLGVLQRSLGSDYLIMPPSVGVWGANVGAKTDLATRLRAIPGVDVVSTLRYALGSTQDKQFSLLGIDPDSYTKVASLTFLDGDPASAFEKLSRERSVILNGVLASQLGMKTGDTIMLSTRRGIKPYLVAAVAGDYLNAKILTAYISQDNLYADYHKDEDIFYQINLKKGADSAMFESRIGKILADYSQFKMISGKQYFEENRQLFNAVFSFYFVLLGILTAPSLIALLNTLSIGVIERTREIGMVRAIGATQKQVRRMVVAESLLLAGIGTVFGLLAGLYLGYLMVVGMKVAGYPVSYFFPWQALIAATLIGIIFGLVASILPARQAARMIIVRALRYE